MKVIQVLNHFLPYQTAGTEVYVASLISTLRQHSNNQIILKVLIPKHEFTQTDSYWYDNIEVIRYAETSIVDRKLIMGEKLPDGLFAFKSVLAKEMPDIVHFHELAGSNGISLHHVRAAKHMGFMTVMTFHLASNTCITGNMLYKEKTFCDGKIDVKKCTSCYLQSKASGILPSILPPIVNTFYKLSIDPTIWNNKLGTALGTSFLIEKKVSRLKELIKDCDQFIVLTQWYKKVLLQNKVPISQITYIQQALPISSTNTIFDTSSSFKAKTLRLVFAGRISAFKGLDLLINALLKLPAHSVSLDIFGYPTNSSYEKRLRKITINYSNIIWRGGVPAGQMSSVLKAYDVLCLCSRFSEMAPLVIQEAFSVQLPVIASDVPGNSEFIKDGINGLLFPFNDMFGLINCINRCVNEPELLVRLKLGIKPPRTFEKVALEHVELYSALLAK
jgi:glycosyltransferase involved in cell wall biosynthesis